MPVRVEVSESVAQEEEDEPLDEYDAAERAQKAYLATLPETMQYTPEKKKFDVEWSSEWRLTMAVELSNHHLTPAHLVIAEDMFGHLQTASKQNTRLCQPRQVSL